jgi:hypothetical protein
MEQLERRKGSGVQGIDAAQARFNRVQCRCIPSWQETMPSLRHVSGEKR